MHRPLLGDYEDPGAVMIDHAPRNLTIWLSRSVKACALGVLSDLLIEKQQFLMWLVECPLKSLSLSGQTKVGRKIIDEGV